MLIIVYQTNTGHRAVGLYNESNAQNKFTLNIEVAMLLRLCTNFQVFCALCFAIFPDEVELLILVLQTFS